MSKFLDENGLKVVKEHLDNKVDKVSGKQLSTEDFTSAEKTKLSGIESGAQVNVQSDWNASSGDAQILNKPTLGSAATKNVGTSEGNVPVLDSNGKLDSSILPAIAVSETFTAASEAAMLALNAQVGDVCIRTDETKTYILANTPASTLSNWKLLEHPADAVLSVAGKTGVVTLVKGDVGLGNVDNTSDLDKPVSTATQTALDAKQATLVSGTNIKTINNQSILGSGNVDIEQSIAYVDSSTTLSELNALITAGKTPIYRSTYSGDAVELPYVSRSQSFYNFGAIIIDRWYYARFSIDGDRWEAISVKYPVNESRKINNKALSSDITLTASDIGLGNVNNTSDLDKPVSTATQTALDAKQATLVSGTNIKTINNQSILGSGNIQITAGVSSVNGETGAVSIGLESSATSSTGAIQYVEVVSFVDGTLNLTTKYLKLQ